VCRLVLTLRVERSVPHLNAMVEMDGRAAPPPFGGGVVVRAESIEGESCLGLSQASWLIAPREYVSVPCVETTGIPGMRASRLPENDGWEMSAS